MIPKVVYQTWKTKSLPDSTQRERERMMKENPEYEFKLFDDKEMDDWIIHHTNKEIHDAYFALNVGAAKADMWRYLILYKEGGIYLDIDSTILQPFRTFICADEKALISRTHNPGDFNQWLLIFEAAHPILKTTIDIVLHNIRHKTTSNVSNLTGPGAYSKAIVYELGQFYEPTKQSLFLEDDNDLNYVFCNPNSPIQCRCMGVDYSPFAKWKYEDASDLYKDAPHWTTIQQIYKE